MQVQAAVAGVSHQAAIACHPAGHTGGRLGVEAQADLKTLFARYVEAKLAQQVLDYDDLLLYWHALMQDAALARDVGQRFDHVLVDEYQDTNTLQAEILLAMKPSGAGLCVVGDDAQSIYSFRAANVENILGFPARFRPAAEVIALEDNYRSTQAILDAANALMAGAAKQFRKNLRARRATGVRPRVVTVIDEAAQAQYVVDTGAGSARRGRAAAPPGGAVSQRAPQRRARTRTRAPRYPVCEIRRPEVPRGLACQGPAGGAALGRQPEEPHRRPARAAVAARDGAGERGTLLSCARNRAVRSERARCVAGTGSGARALAGAGRVIGRSRRPRARLARAGGCGAPVVRAAPCAAVRRTGTRRGPRAAGAHRAAVRHARAVPHRTHARPAAGELRPCGRAAHGRGLPDPLHGPFGQGAGVGQGAHAERDRRELPERVRHRQARADRRGTPPALRGDDPRQGRTAPHHAAQVLRRAAAALGRCACVRGAQPVPRPQGHGGDGRGGLAGRRRGGRGTVAVPLPRIDVAARLRGQWA